MLIYSAIFSNLIFFSITTEAQYYLYYTDTVSETDLYYDCLHYAVPNEYFHQITPYCIRPLSKTVGHEGTMIRGNISSNFTFHQLKEQNITTQDLLLWFAPIDLIERYQNYLDTPMLALASELFYNCTLLWFGPLCQYTLKSNEPFSDIVAKTFMAKANYTNRISILNITNLTCYMHLQCNRGPAPICLDWREICDGRIDCLGDGIDEKQCIDLEINECEQNEYRCHNGMCIPEQFINDNPINPECLDHTDENDHVTLIFFKNLGFNQCFVNPAFLCEESDPFLGFRGFVCGDGAQIKTPMPGDLSHLIKQTTCANGRDLILTSSVLGNALNSSSVTSECQILIVCFTLTKYGFDCIKLLCAIPDFCLFLIQKMCDQSSYVIFPMLPIIQAYAQFGHWTNELVTYESLEQILIPNFVCYDKQRCPFFPSTFKIDNWTCFNNSNAYQMNLNRMITFFHKCLPVDESGNETDCFHPSLFHCPKTSKCISKHRLLDGIEDCFDGADELYTESCNLSHRHRFRCTSENTCISPVLMHDSVLHCHEGEDEFLHYKQKLPFQRLCDGYADLPAVLIDGKNETDETNCEQWPCNNSYTRCDFIWACPNGADEINCDSTSKCYPNRHECISPTTFKSICLSMDRVGDGNIDCLGAIDEREHCRRMYPGQSLLYYRCWNDTSCTFPLCSEISKCQFETSNSIQKICEEDEYTRAILEKDVLIFSFKVTLTDEFNKYFVLGNTSRFQLNASFTSLIMVHDSWAIPTGNISRVHTDSSFNVLSKEIDSHHAWICNRGIVVFVGTQENEQCLCPPSYYGNRCQFQNQRISLTLRFSKECAPICHGVYGIVLKLVDNDQDIHSYEQLTYISTKNCTMKYNIYLLYRFRPKNLTKNYSIHIDAYNKIDLTYYTSWILPVKLLFLPVNRIAAYLIIPAHPVGIPKKCPLVCGDHGHCAVYGNTGEYFCRCDSPWSGWNCSIRQDDCNCAAESICFGKVSNRSICLCPPNKLGPRCLIHSICHTNPCKNGGQCVPEDDRVSMSNFTCMCGVGYSGNICDVRDTRIEISFSSVKIPHSLKFHFVTMQNNGNPLITTIVKKVAFDQDSIVLYTSVLFNLIFVEIDTEFYLAFLQVDALRSVYIGLEMKTLHRCPTVGSLFDERTFAFPLLRRVKYYHAPCQNHSKLSCLHDKEDFMCLCNKDNYANCFPFDFNETSICPGGTICENEAQCHPDRATCPTSTICICPECFYGGRCQFTTKTLSLSLDVILGYHIRPNVMIIHQSVPVTVSIALTTLMLVIGLINSILSIMTFKLKKLCDVGIGLYLLALSIISLISTIVFVLKFWLLVFTQMASITNRTVLLINCISIEFISRSLLTMVDWFSACVAIERMIVVIKGINFNQARSKQNARWAMVIVVLCILLSLVHDPIHRQLVHDEEEQRTWCVVRYSSAMKIFDSTMHILHFFVPFSINLISALVIIVRVAQTHSNTRKQKTYREHLRKEFHQQKHLIISPIILVILSIPRLVISLLPGCMKSIRDPWLFLMGYFISFMPPLLTFVVFVWPSETYKKEFYTMVKRYRMIIH